MTSTLTIKYKSSSSPKKICSGMKCNKQLFIYILGFSYSLVPGENQGVTAGKWMKELPSVLWALLMTPSHAIGQTLFLLVYGSDAMLPTEVEHKSF
jgi:hypothetical protein